MIAYSLTHERCCPSRTCLSLRHLGLRSTCSSFYPRTFWEPMKEVTPTFFHLRRWRATGWKAHLVRQRYPARPRIATRFEHSGLRIDADQLDAGIGKSGVPSPQSSHVVAELGK